MVRGVFIREVCCYVLIFLNCWTTLQTMAAAANGLSGEIEGDIYLGGLFRIHRRNGTNRCGKDIEVEVGIQRAEAMVYAIKEINNNKKLLPNLTLGAEIRDSCSLGTFALDESLKFILDSLSLRAISRSGRDCARNVSQPKDVVGVVGASRSSFSIEVANLLRLFKVPQVSYASTSAELSNKKKYSYFSRTVPPDTQQALAMLHVIKKLNWTSVYTVNSAGSYGEKGIKQFKKHAKNSSLCVVSSEQVTDRYVAKDYDKIIDNFRKFSNETRVVVLFMKDDHVKQLLQSANSKNYIKDKVWIASDEWGTRDDILAELPCELRDNCNAITVSLSSPPIPGFKEYFNRLNCSAANTRKSNPWFVEYVAEQKQSNTTCGNTTKFNDKLSYVIDAVYAFAHALDKIYKKRCPNRTGLCSAMNPVNGTELRDHILRVKFNGISGNIVEFDKNGDSKGKYNIFHYTGPKGDYKYEQLGEWQGVLNLTKIPTSLINIRSTCSDQCDPWSRKLQKLGTSCCIMCSECQKDRQYVNASNRKCEDCDYDQRPNATYNGCENLPLRYIPNEWVIVVSIFAGLGVVSSLIVIVLFIYNINTPLVKASARDLIFPLLIGVLLNYIVTFFLVSKPSIVICAIQRFGYGFPSSVCYASILMKTNRIARIFANRNLKSVSFTKPYTQLVILLLLIGIHVSLVSVGLIMKPPDTIKILPTAENILAKCNFTRLDYAISIPYNLLLVIICTIYSFRTRKIPSSFNEARYLGFVMYTTCIIWIAFLPVYYGTAENYQPIVLSLNTILSATTILLCLFGRKVFILVFRRVQNVQSSLAMTTSHSVADHSSSIAGTLNNINFTTNENPQAIQEAKSNNSTSKPSSSSDANNSKETSVVAPQQLINVNDLQVHFVATTM